MLRGMTAELGLRERKKQQTRQAIAEAAFELFVERGFEAVPVAEVARRADVSEATVFNHFPTKEDLVYHRFAAFSAELLGAVRDRPPTQSIPAAFFGFLRRTHGLVGSKDPAVAQRLERITRVVTGSPALQARERQIYDDYTSQLATLIAEETGARPGDVEPWVLANALIGVHRALIAFVRTNVLAGTTGTTLARRVRAQCDKATALLDRGLSGYR
jgi:AcrR family transcriptional regulator